ncbi:TraB family protein [Candidatus Woesearchaeota archaeon]|nr:MAG: TraB family protein [Candidatus Woesearchaeota archaeon]
MLLRYRNLVVVGTSHIAKESVEEAKRVILREKPDAVALELDKARLFALLEKRKAGMLEQIRHLGFRGFILNTLGAWVEAKLGKLVGVKPGSEMLAAVDAAKEIGAKIYLVDRRIEVTLRRLINKITFREKLRFVFDLFAGLFLGKGIKIDISKVPSKEVIEQAIAYVRTRYPNVYKVLIEERNRFIARNLCRLMEQHKLVVAVLGAGHCEDVIGLIESGKI